MPKKYRIIVGHGTLSLRVFIPYMGEHQIEDSIYGLKNHFDRIGSRCEIIIFSGFKNKDVHQLIYDQVGLSDTPSIKLDADMCIDNYDELNRYLDKLDDDFISIVPVYCWIARKKIYGVHIFGSKVSGIESSDDLFPDKYIWDKTSIIPINSPTPISHCKNPSIYQLENFIGHRLRKFIRSKCVRIDYLPLVLRALFYNFKVAFSFKKITEKVIRNEYKHSKTESGDIELPTSIKNMVKEIT